MRTIHKYHLAIVGPGALHVKMPKDARLLHLGSQHHMPMLWAEVDTDAPIEHRVFMIYGTGRECTHNPLFTTYIGTLVGTDVWHVYEVFS